MHAHIHNFAQFRLQVQGNDDAVRLPVSPTRGFSAGSRLTLPYTIDSGSRVGVDLEKKTLEKNQPSTTKALNDVRRHGDPPQSASERPKPV